MFCLPPFLKNWHNVFKLFVYRPLCPFYLLFAFTTLVLRTWLFLTFFSFYCSLTSENSIYGLLFNHFITESSSVYHFPEADVAIVLNTRKRFWKRHCDTKYFSWVDYCSFLWWENIEKVFCDFNVLQDMSNWVVWRLNLTRISLHGVYCTLQTPAVRDGGLIDVCGCPVSGVSRVSESVVTSPGQ